MIAALYTLVRDPSSDVSHPVRASVWMRLGYPPRPRCDARVGERWTVTASARSLEDAIRLSYCCPKCKTALSQKEKRC